MKKEIAVGIQDFEALRQKDAFYIDKTDFIREWWDGEDIVTLITRPRRFGKTLNMSMLNCFFSNKYAGRADLFEGLSIWNENKYRELQGVYPVLFLSFAGIKQTSFENTRRSINRLIADTCNQYNWLLTEGFFTDSDRKFFQDVTAEMNDDLAAVSLKKLCDWLYQYYGKKVLILLDEYDTPLQEAYVNGFWDESVAYISALFNNTFKTNPSLERAVLTGITMISKESVFSDLNNLTVNTTTSSQYAASFGFTEEEVFRAMTEQGFGEKEQADVKRWYDGFAFGNVKDIYNPWSVTYYLNEGKVGPYWANSSGNGLISHLLRRGSAEIKIQFEKLLYGKEIAVFIDEQIVYNALDTDPEAVFSLLLASGYLKVQGIIQNDVDDEPVYRLSLTNLETRKMFDKMVTGWFARGGGLSRFADVMLKGDVRGMNRYLNEIALASMSYFDSGNSPSFKEPENFYHGLVLGLLVENAPDYIVKSNRESGYGRYDVILEPKDIAGTAVILEFKVFDEEDRESSLEDTAMNALSQIEDRKYETDLLSRGIPAENIRKYGIAFQGKTCLVRAG